MITKPGFYFDIPAATYHADPCPGPSLNQTVVKVLLERSPLHALYEHPRLTPTAAEAEGDDEKYDKAKAIGSAAHAMLLGRGAQLAVGEFKDWRTKEAKAFRSEAESAGKIVILESHHDRAVALASAARKALDANAAIFTDGKPEVVIAWKEGDVWCRSMIDWLHDGRTLIDDLKTTALTAAPHAIPWLLADAGWDIQAAFQERGLNALDPDNAGRRRFRFICVENAEPFALTVNELLNSVLEVGRRKVDAAIRLWAKCLTANVWPGYPPCTNFPEMPANRLAAWEEREAQLEDLIYKPGAAA